MIKNFIYLDEQKMYSLSSQIFEGITEYVLKEELSEDQNTESQKGPVGSGKILADVIITSSRETEKKFLHDYSYTIFERYLIDNNLVLNISSPFIELEELKKVTNNFSFIKIKAKAVFNDVEKITELFSRFNAIGEAIAHMGKFQEINEIKIEIDKLKLSTANKNEKSKLYDELNRLTNITKIAKEQGLYQDPIFLNNLALLTKYGFSDQFEIQQFGGDALFTSCLKRGLLREKEDILVKKYSRKTEKEVVVLGVISQAFSASEPNINNNSDFPNMKTALMNMVEHLTFIENSISGKQVNEVVVDPIAVYFEV